MIVAVTIVFGSLVTGCMEKDVYNPDAGKQPLPDPDEYFGFETRGDVKLLVNYDVPGFTALVEVYDEDPMETVEGTPVKKEGVEAIFKTYTDNNGKYEGEMHIPTSVKTVYLYTAAWGLPRCVQLNVENNAVNFDMSVKKQKSSTRSYLFNGQVPYTINGRNHLYSLCKWGEAGSLDGTYLKSVDKIGDETPLEVAERLMKFFNPNGMSGVNNSYLYKGPRVTNIKITVETMLDVIFLKRDASYDNTFGYYYYKTDEEPQMISSVDKYIVFPNVKLFAYEGKYLPILKCGNKARLLYFDEDGKASEKFPAGYTVGWFIYADGFNGYYHDYDVKENEIRTKELRTSNEAFGNLNGFVSVKDEKSGKTIIGVEDGANQSYCDLLFYVDATPEGSIDDPDRPIIKPDDGKDDPEPDPVEPLKGTLAFEDIWPSGGDYDLNDVIIEYHRSITFNKDNYVSEVKETYEPVQKVGAATNRNAFAVQYATDQRGEMVLPSGAVDETQTNSIILFPNAMDVRNQKFVITRTFAAGAMKKDALKVGNSILNPYIIVNYEGAGKDNRTEVHLPKSKATNLANSDQIGKEADAYYVNKDGKHPFAISIPGTFTSVTETVTIDKEYPDFEKWVESDGKEYTDWYKNYQKSAN